MNFETALREELTNRPRGGRRGRRLKKLLDAKPSARRTRILARLERHAVATLEAEQPKVLKAATRAGKIDWSAIDWEKVFDLVMKVLLALLPLLLV